MDELLKDKRIMAGIIVGGLVALVALFFLFKGLFIEPPTEFADDSTPSASTPAGGPGGPDSAATPAAVPGGTSETPPGMPGSMGAPGAPGAASETGGKGEKAQPPVEIARADPFASLIPPPKKPSPDELLAMNAQTELAALPPLTIYQPNPTALAEGGAVTGPALAPQEEADNSQRRVAGIVMGKSASAILEIDGGTVVVKPGDVLPDLSRVERIERDRVLLRKGQRAIFVPLASSPNGPTGGGVTGGGNPGTAGPGTAGPYGAGRRMPGMPPGLRGGT